MSKDIKSKIEDALFNFYLEADKDTITNILQEDIPNYDDYTKKKKRLVFLANAAVKQKRNDRLLNLASQFQEAIIQNVGRPIAMLKSLIQTNPAFSMYRNLNTLSKEDIIEIIKDKNLVELIEQLEESDEVD